jgi:hypothetical protein
MSLRADRYREKAAEAKDRAAQARELSIKTTFEDAAAGWIALAEQAEGIDRSMFPVGGEDPPVAASGVARGLSVAKSQM